MDATAQELIARLRRNPEDASAFASLRAHYERLGDYASLANLLEGWAGRATDPAAAAQALFEAGELVLGALDDRDRSIAIYERALSSEPQHRDAFLRLQGLFEDAGENRRLAALLERQSAALQQAGAAPREVALLHHQLGELWEHRFGRPEQAVEHYRQAYELDPRLVPAIYAAREILRRAGNVSGAAALLEREAKTEPDQKRRIALWRELAHLRGELEDHEGAALALKRALAEAPADLELMVELAQVYLTRAQRGHDARVAASDRLRAADFLFQIAQKVAPESALAYLESALDARPDHEGALTLYERLVEEREPARLPARWVAYLAHAADRPEAGARRRRLAEAYLRAGQVEYAITCLEWLLEEGDPRAADRLVELYRSQGREDDAVRALGLAAEGLAPAERLPRLRELISALRARGDAASAAGYAQQILAVDPADPEALTLLEDAARQTGDYAPLRDALRGASRVASASPESRKQRLKQVASISEQRIGDLDGAIGAWRGVAALDPADREARAALERLLTAASRWDELVDVLERDALSLDEPAPKADVYRKLAVLHRIRRGDLESAIEALRNVRELAPHDRASRDALLDALLEAGAALEAIPLLRQRIEEGGGAERAGLLRTLAQVLEERVGNPEGAFGVWAQLLDENPSDLDAIGRMEAIDEATGQHERLLSTLSYRLEVSAAAERPSVLARMARIADEGLGDLDRAAELYEQALELAPGELAVLDGLADVYARAERHRELVVLLRRTAQAEPDVGRRAELYRRIARTLADRVGNEGGAAEAWREVLAAGEDEEALRFLVRHAAREDDPSSLEELLRRLGALLGATAEARDLALERAELLAERLERVGDAIAVLRHLVDALDSTHLGALERLSVLCAQVEDRAGLVDALWRQLALVSEPVRRLAVSQRLADLHEAVPEEIDRAIEALFAWTEALPEDPTPLRRLVPLLERTARARDIVGVLDALGELEVDEAEVSRLVRWAAQIAHQTLRDTDGAWARLERRVRAGDSDAEQDLRELARSTRRGEALAELYTALAQEASSADPRPRWTDAARVYEEYLGDHVRALEATLRAFAVDLSDPETLSEVDRLAERAGAWPRLAQVYETLLRRAASPEDKVALLLRHAALLDDRAKDASAALDVTLRACALAPLDDVVLALAEERAPRAGRAEELLVTFERRKQRATEDAGRVEALLRAVRLCESVLKDRTRALPYLAQAVALTVRTPSLEETVVAEARALDAKGGTVRQTVIELLVTLSDDMETDPVGGARVLVRAARLASAELSAQAEAFALLQRAAVFAPGEGSILDELDGFARPRGRLREVDAHLEKLVDEALDGRTAGELLRRRGRLLEELGDHRSAAEVWTQLSTVLAADAEARERLRACLRAAGRHQELLVELARDLRQARAPAERRELLKAVARVWEEDLGNRWEALDAWKKVAKEHPDDEQARAAIGRLEAKKHVESDVALAVPRIERSGEDEYADLTDPSEGATEEPSGATFDAGPRAARAGAAQAAAGAQDLAATDAHTAENSAETRPVDASTAASAETPTRELSLRGERPAGSSAPSRSLPEVPAQLSTLSPAEDFEDEHTAVGEEDLYGLVEEAIAARPTSSNAAPSQDGFDDVSTGDVQLRDTPEPRESSAGRVEGEHALEEVEALDDVGALDEMGEIDELEEVEALEDVDELEDVEALDDMEEMDELEEVEEVEEVEELELPSGASFSAPPPPPRRR